MRLATLLKSLTQHLSLAEFGLFVGAAVLVVPSVNVLALLRVVVVILMLLSLLLFMADVWVIREAGRVWSKQVFPASKSAVFSGAIELTGGAARAHAAIAFLIALGILFAVPVLFMFLVSML